MHRGQVLLFLLFAVAIAGLEVNAESAKKNCKVENSTTFESWQEWAQITSKPVISQAHSNNWVGIYVDELARDTYLSAGAPYRECAKIVKPIYGDAEGNFVRKLTIMVKMPLGYDPENGDWWYASYDATGTKVREQGRLNGCIPCHKQAAKTDYMFSKEVLDATKD